MPSKKKNVSKQQELQDTQMKQEYKTNHGIIKLTTGINIGSIATDENGNILKSKILYDFDSNKHFLTDNEGKIITIYTLK
jgi:hypothetical protein